jgi:hypothetical protein
MSGNKAHDFRIHSLVWYILTCIYFVVYICMRMGDWPMDASCGAYMSFYGYATAIYCVYSFADMVFLRIKYKKDTPVFRYMLAICLSALYCSYMFVVFHQTLRYA